MNVFKKNSIITHKRKWNVIASNIPADIQQINETEMLNLSFNWKWYKVFIDVVNEIKNNDYLIDQNWRKYTVEDVEKDEMFWTFYTIIVDAIL